MKNNKKAFTLVELLVVIAILGILATVTVVGYTAYIKYADNSVALQELTQLRQAMIADDIDNEKYTLSGNKGFEGAEKTPATDPKTYYTVADIYAELKAGGLKLQGTVTTAEVGGQIVVTYSVGEGSATWNTKTNDVK